MSEPVLLSVVNSIRDLMRRPAVPAGRVLIDHELNKKRDPKMATALNNAIRWLVQEGELARQTNETEPRWWLVERGIPTDRDDQVIPLTTGLERPFDGELIDDTKPKRAAKEPKVVEQPPPAEQPVTVVHVPKDSFLAETLGLKEKPAMKLDERIINTVTRLCAATNRPVARQAILEDLKDFSDSRTLKMRLAYVCKIKGAVIFWEPTADRDPMYWPKDQELDEDIADSMGPVSNKRKPKKAPKRKAPEPEVVAQPTVFALDLEADPVWSIDSTGELGCIVDGQYVMVLAPKHAASLNRFMQATNGVHANKDHNVT